MSETIGLLRLRDPAFLASVHAATRNAVRMRFTLEWSFVDGVRRDYYEDDPSAWLEWKRRVTRLILDVTMSMDYESVKMLVGTSTCYVDTGMLGEELGIDFRDLYTGVSVGSLAHRISASHTLGEGDLVDVWAAAQRAIALQAGRLRRIALVISGPSILRNVGGATLGTIEFPDDLRVRIMDFLLPPPGPRRSRIVERMRRPR